MTTAAPETLFVALAAQERRVLHLLLPNRRLAASIVKAAGLAVHHFAQDDHKLIFAGWLVACEHDLPIVRTLRLIRRALQETGLWDDETPMDSQGMRHSDETLATLGVHRMTEEELDEAVGRGPEDGLRRAIARHIVALVEASDTLVGVTL